MVGPDYDRPDTTAHRSEGFVNVPASWADGEDIENVGRWWQRFDDSAMNILVEDALKNNTDLQAAAASVLEAEALLAAAHGGRLPTVSYSAGRTHSKTSFSLFGTRQSFFDTTYSQDLSVSYMVDFFGKLKRTEQAAFADLQASAASREALVHAIIAQVIRARIEIATQQRLLDVVDSTVVNWRDYLEIVERRYEQGLVGPLDVHLARENLSSALSQKPTIEQTLKITEHSLDVLVGTGPGTGQRLAQTLSDLPPIEPVPIGLPAKLLDRRPDVRSAEMQLAAATERVGISIAAMYPDLTLTASGGYRSDHFRMVTATENEVYSTVVGLAMPIFQGGSLKAQVRAAKARAERAAANYAGVVLTAMREVEDALVREQALRERIELLESRFGSAYMAEKLARERYVQGLEKVLTVLETERRRRVAENELVIAKGQLWNARIDLMLALGGDWGVEQIKTENVDSSGTKNESQSYAGDVNG